MAKYLVAFALWLVACGGGQGGDTTPSVSLLAPEPGAVVREGMPLVLEWEVRFPTTSRLRVQVSRDDRETWTTVGSTPAREGRTEWRPNFPGDRVWVRLADGKDREFSSPVPVRVRPVPREFAISTYFVFAVMSDGTLRYWGTHPSGLKAEFAGKQYFARRPVEDRSAELAIGHHGLALREDGTVLAWGRNGGGQLGDGTREDRHTPRTVCGLDDVVAVASRGKHSLALRRDGTPWSWGESFWGQLGHREDVSNLLPAPVEGLADITAITSGFYSSYAVRADGAVFGWGLNDRGQLGVGDKETQRFPARTKGPPFIAIWAGNANVHALTADKDWYAWGSNLFLEGGTGSRRDLTRPLKQDMK